MLKTILILLAAILAGCNTAEPTKPIPFNFDIFVESNLGETTRKTTPPNCGTWVKFLRGVVKKESNWKQDAEYTENFIDHSTGKKSVSAGYFQLSIGDKSHYKGIYCQQLSPTGLKNPVVNTGCALEIIEKLLNEAKTRNQTPRQAMGRYWSVIRNSKEDCNG